MYILRIMKKVIFICVLFFCSLLSVSVVCQVNPQKSQQFDFWIGEWDVNLRMIQPDLSWEDKIKATTHVYSILRGKAILELWDNSESGIIGHSLRYYNPDSDLWDLFLNWPGKNRSGTGRMSGKFRHGRCEFYNTPDVSDTTITVERYTFSDITPGSFRWDDGYSNDGGKSWRGNWIMEFSRIADIAPEFDLDTSLNTYYSGKRCDAEEFKVLDSLIGKYEPGLTVYPILDGCSVMGLSEDLYFKFTYNTYASLYELTVLSSNPSQGLWIYYGNKTDDKIELKTSKNDQEYHSVIQLGDGSFNINYYNNNYALAKNH